MHSWSHPTDLLASLNALPVQIATPWQAAVSVVQSFPRTTDLLAAVDALALEEGEPPGTVFQAAAEACDIQELPGTVTSLGKDSITTKKVVLKSNDPY